MNEKPFELGIIVPAYNAEQYLGVTLDSLLSQTHPIESIIVIDDGSTDATSKVCDDYAKKYKKVKYFTLDKNYGESRAVNFGWEVTRAKFVSIVSADDPQPNEWVSQMFSAIQDNDGYIFYYPNVLIIDESNKVLSRAYSSDFNQDKVINRLICLPSAGTIISKFKLSRDFVPRDENCLYPSDLIQFMTLSLIGKGLYVSNSWAQWRKHSAGLSNTLPFLKKYTSFIESIDRWIKNNHKNLNIFQVQEIYANLAGQGINSLIKLSDRKLADVKLMSLFIFKKSANPIFIFKLVTIAFRSSKTIFGRL